MMPQHEARGTMKTASPADRSSIMAEMQNSAREARW